MSTPISAKHSLYKPATPLERSTLQQGTLKIHDASINSFLASPRANSGDRGASSMSLDHHSGLVGVDPSSSPRQPLPSSLTASFPVEECAHLLSLSDSDLDSPQSSSLLHVTEPHPPTLLTTGTPSPVTIVAHFPLPEEEEEEEEEEEGGKDWRRFSSNFVTPPLVVREPGASGEGGTTTQQDNAITAPVHLDSSEIPASVSITTVLPADTSAASHTSQVSHDQSHDQSHDVGAGIGRSSSEEIMSHRPKKNESVHSRSAELSTIHEQHSDTSVGMQAKGTAKKKPNKGRVVPSRYLTSSSSSSARKPLLTPQSLASKRQPHTAKKTAGKPVRSRADDSFRIPTLPSNSRSFRPSQPRPSHHHSSTPALHHQTPSLNLSAFTPSGLTTSTPAVGMVTGPAHHEAVHDGSFMALSREDSGTLIASTKTKPHPPASASKAVRLSRNVATSDSSHDWEMELLYNRLLQMTYLDVMSCRALKEQENEAKTQLYTLWRAVEERRKENCSLRKAIATEQWTIALEKSLEVQLQGLGPVCSRLAELRRTYGSMAQALDTTRHDLPLTAVCPCSQDELEAELMQSERLLGDILRGVREKIPRVAGFADSVQAVVKTLETEYEELERCWQELEGAVKMQIHEASLYFEKKQRS